jgi:hypothetical protein
MAATLLPARSVTGRSGRRCTDRARPGRRRGRWWRHRGQSRRPGGRRRRCLGRVVLAARGDAGRVRAGSARSVGLHGQSSSWRLARLGVAVSSVSFWPTVPVGAGGLARPGLLRDPPGGRLSPLLVRAPIARRQPPRPLLRHQTGTRGSLGTLSRGEHVWGAFFPLCLAFVAVLVRSRVGGSENLPQAAGRTAGPFWRTLGALRTAQCATGTQPREAANSLPGALGALSDVERVL